MFVNKSRNPSASEILSQLFLNKELRSRVLTTLGLLLLVRLGIYIPMPGIDRVAFKSFIDQGGQMPLYRRVPKLKHFEIINQKNFSIINLEKLNDFKDNDTVNLDSLVKKGLIFKPKFPLKILGNGKINVKLKVQAHAFTKAAKQKIEDAGGSCELLNNK